MNATELRRVDLSEAADEELIQRSSQELGYTVMREKTLRADARAALARAGVRPFDYDQVGEYMDAVEEKANRDLGWWGRNFNGRDMQWFASGLENYKGEVPAYALRTALDVKRELGDVKHYFGVLYLAQARDETDGDPFLYVEVDGRREFLEVWNEPGFFTERTV
jgi:hypothetical protein